MIKFNFFNTVSARKKCFYLDELPEKYEKHEKGEKGEKHTRKQIINSKKYK